MSWALIGVWNEHGIVEPPCRHIDTLLNLGGWDLASADIAFALSNLIPLLLAKGLSVTGDSLSSSSLPLQSIHKVV
jgi:hypothetical protein